jgi:hypothetical protein
LRMLSTDLSGCRMIECFNEFCSRKWFHVGPSCADVDPDQVRRLTRLEAPFDDRHSLATNLGCATTAEGSLPASSKPKSRTARSDTRPLSSTRCFSPKTNILLWRLSASHTGHRKASIKLYASKPAKMDRMGRISKFGHTMQVRSCLIQRNRPSIYALLVLPFGNPQAQE